MPTPTGRSAEFFYDPFYLVQQFTVPDDVTLLYLTAVAGGGAGAGHTAIDPGSSHGGGGGGQFCIRYPLLVTSGEVIDITVGEAGAGAVGQGTDGGDTIIDTIVGTIVLRGGEAPIPVVGSGVNADRRGGAGGGFNGAPRTDMNKDGVRGTYGPGSLVGGSSGGAGVGGIAPGRIGGGCINFPVGAPAGGGDFGGGGGGNSPFGIGGVGGQSQLYGLGGPADGNTPFAGAYGAGGGGSGPTHTGGTTALGGGGAAGYVLIEWIAS